MRMPLVLRVTLLRAQAAVSQILGKPAVAATASVLTEYPIQTFGVMSALQIGLVSSLIALPLSASAAPPTMTEYPVPAGSGAYGITQAPDGAMWFTIQGFGRIGRITVNSSPVVTSFSIPTPGSFPFGIASNPATGTLWFTEGDTNKIGRISTDGTITEFTIPSTFPPGFLGVAFAQGIALGSDGAMWFAENGTGKIGRITADGTLTEFDIPSVPNPQGITLGPDGAMWFTEGNINHSGTSNQIGRITTDAQHTITEYPIPTPLSGPSSIAMGPDGALWFTEQTAGKIGRITVGVSPVITEFVIPTPNSAPNAITLGPDGAIWFTEASGNKIGRIATDASHAVTEIPVTTANSGLQGIASGPNSTIWFTEGNAAQIGRIDIPTALLSVTKSGNGQGLVTSDSGVLNCGLTCNATVGAGTLVTLTASADSGSTFTGWSGGGCLGVGICQVTLAQATTINASFVGNTSSDITLVSALLPTSRSVQVGTPATFFGTMINASTDTAGANCTVAPTTNIPASFSFQTTDPATNATAGTPNTPVTIQPGAAQSFVLAFTPSAVFIPTDIAFSFTCTNANAAASNKGLNTLLLSASTTPVPDVIALVATVSNDGIVNIPGTTGTGAFAVATANVGASGTITAAANAGAANLPVTITICQTNPTSGQCLNPPSPSVQALVNAGTTPTFAVFIAGKGNVPFQPAANRIFVQFQDAGGSIRGSTSVAVRTQ